MMEEPICWPRYDYVERNPVAARLCRRPEDGRWSSAVALMRGRDDGLLEVRPMLSRLDDGTAYLLDAVDDGISVPIVQHCRTDRPLSEERFVQKLRRITKHALTCR